MEDKNRYGRIQHAPNSLDLAPFDFAFFSQLKSDLHGLRFSDLNDFVISMENGFNDTGNAYNTRESILKNCVFTGSMTLFSFDVVQSAPYIVT